MKWRFLLGILLIVALMIKYEWPKINQKKEKAAFAVLTAIGCMLAVLLILYPNLPTPTQFVDSIYRPLGKLLEN
jgi:multisubunit Na+/H+ antiporter MnhB subunit